MTTGTFVYIWIYEVAAENWDEFRDLYGPTGPWGALFRRAPGYLDTEILVDLSGINRFVSIDRWESKAAFDLFRSEFAEEFEALDVLGEGLTSNEVLLGEFGAASVGPFRSW